jgi:hypothetical protein
MKRSYFLIILIVSLSFLLVSCQGVELDNCKKQLGDCQSTNSGLVGQNTVLQKQLNDAICERESWKNATGTCQSNLGVSQSNLEVCQKNLKVNADIAKALSGGGILFQICFAFSIIYFGKIFDDNRFKRVKLFAWLFWGLVWLFVAYVLYIGWL